MKEIIKEENDIKPMKNTKGFMMAAKYKNKLKEHLIKN